MGFGSQKDRGSRSGWGSQKWSGGARIDRGARSE